MAGRSGRDGGGSAGGSGGRPSGGQGKLGAAWVGARRGVGASWTTARRVGLAVVDSDTAGSLARDATQALATAGGVARALRSGESLPSALGAAAQSLSELGQAPGPEVGTGTGREMGPGMGPGTSPVTVDLTPLDEGADEPTSQS